MTPQDECVCGRCFEDAPVLFAAPCIEKPEDLKGAPIGMYRCPDCGTMVLAGIPHPAMCLKCWDEVHAAVKSLAQDTPSE